MSKPQISVIIPVYNTAAYLLEAISSIQEQTLKEIEIIIINDGSTDGSELICKELAATDYRIKYVEQTNQGQSAARNMGLIHATGRYIYCMDSDDTLDLNALEELYQRAEKDELEFLFFDGEILCESGQSPLSWDYHRTEKYSETTIYQGIPLLEDMLNHCTHRAVPWLLLIKRSHLIHLGLNYYPGIIQEDELFTVLLYLQSNRVGCMKKRLVQHRVRSNSTMTNRYSLRNIAGYLTVVDELFAYATKTKQKEIISVVKQYAHYTLSRVFYTAHCLSFTDKCTAFKWSLKRNYLCYWGLKTIAVLEFK